MDPFFRRPDRAPYADIAPVSSPPFIEYKASNGALTSVNFPRRILLGLRWKKSLSCVLQLFFSVNLFSFPPSPSCLLTFPLRPDFYSNLDGSNLGAVAIWCPLAPLYLDPMTIHSKERFTTEASPSFPLQSLTPVFDPVKVLLPCSG